MVLLAPINFVFSTMIFFVKKVGVGLPNPKGFSSSKVLKIHMKFFE